MLTTGTFDGVHLGHQTILHRLKEIAQREEGSSVLFTFYPHPRLVLQPTDNDLKLLSTQQEKIALVPEAGIRLDVDIIHPVRPDTSKSTVILLRESAGTDQPTLDQEAATWVEAGHVVAITPLRGTLVMPEKADGFWQERYRTAMRAILIGKTMPGMRVQDLLAIYDYVSSRPELGERVIVVGRRNLGVVALYAAALEPKISRVVLDQSLLSYMEIVRAKQYPETVSDLIVPGALLDFDLPDLADLAGAGRVVLANPLSAAGTPVSVAAATAAFGKNTRVVVEPSIAISKP